MPPSGVGTVTVQYDVSQIDFQGIYTADVLITTNAQPIAKASAASTPLAPITCHSNGAWLSST